MKTDQGAAVHILPDELTITIDGKVFLQDPQGNPLSPEDWWELVDQAGSRVVVAVVPDGTPFEQRALIEAHDALLDSLDTALSVVPVVHH